MFLLPQSISGATQNMKADIAMLDDWLLPDSPRLRFYDWRGKCATCGMSQNVDEVRQLFPPEFDICARSSGGGIVDHTNSITYALVAPRNTALCEMHALDSYMQIHRAIVDVLESFGVKSKLNDIELYRGGKLSQCFSNPAKYDVMCIENSQKIAGAAQKRNRNGMLTQGSIAKSPIANIDFEIFKRALSERFAKIFAEAVEGIAMPAPINAILENQKTLIEE